MYLDSCILVKLLIREPDSEFYGQWVDGHPVSSSLLAYTEVWSALLARERAQLIRTRLRLEAWQRFEDQMRMQMIDLSPVSEAIVRRAHWILGRVHPKVPLRSLDALHLATADQLQDWPLVTSDQRLREAALHLGYPLSDLPSPIPPAC
ncbi:MAG: type II toxin-antitoxin system VapC family toxin [Limisphaerales bacterium]|jgi:predicted nucleic acid-binding protein